MGRLPNKQKQNPKLIQREMSDGRASLWLEYYLGRSESPVYDDDGNHVVYESGAMKGKLKYKVQHLRKKELLICMYGFIPARLRNGSRTRTPSPSPRRYGLRKSRRCLKTERVTA